MTEKHENEEICCPEFIPKQWDNQILEWDNKIFVKGKVKTFFFMPLGFGKVITKLNEQIDAHQATIPDWLGLCDHTSKWNMDIYLAVDKEVPTLENVKLSGKYFSKVYEGAFNNTEKWCKEYEALAKLKGLTIEKMYMWYTTCPKCAKKYGKNYVVIISEVKQLKK